MAKTRPRELRSIVWPHCEYVSRSDMRNASIWRHGIPRAVLHHGPDIAAAAVHEINSMYRSGGTTKQHAKREQHQAAGWVRLWVQP